MKHFTKLAAIAAIVTILASSCGEKASHPQKCSDGTTDVGGTADWCLLVPPGSNPVTIGRIFTVISTAQRVNDLPHNGYVSLNLRQSPQSASLPLAGMSCRDVMVYDTTSDLYFSIPIVGDCGSLPSLVEHSLRTDDSAKALAPRDVINRIHDLQVISVLVFDRPSIIRGAWKSHSTDISYATISLDPMGIPFLAEHEKLGR